MKKFEKSMQSGITLIALIITIIVLLILAGVSISLVVGDNGVLNQSQQASTKTNKASELETIQLAVAGSFNDEGNLDLATLVTNLRNEMPAGTEVETGKDDENNDIVIVTAKYGKYEINGNGNVEKLSGAVFSQSLIEFVEGEDTSVRLMVNPVEGSKINSVNWGNLESNAISLTTNGNSAIVKLENATLDLATNGENITAVVTTEDGKEHILNCFVMYSEKIISSLAISSGNLELQISKNNNGIIEVEGKGKLGSTINLAEDDLNNITISAEHDDNYVTIESPTIVDGKVTANISAVSETSNPEKILVFLNDIVQQNIEVIVSAPPVPKYGDYIDFGKDLIGTTSTEDDWKILYNGINSDDTTVGGKIYCILADYLPNSKRIECGVETGFLTNGTYCVRTGNRNTLVTKLTSDWSVLVGKNVSDIEDVVVIGALDKNTHDKMKEQTGNKYYIPRDDIYDGCYGYWLSSISSYGNECIGYTTGEFGVSGASGKNHGWMAYSDSSKIGVCPVVILPSNLELVQNENQVWTIVD